MRKSLPLKKRRNHPENRQRSLTYQKNNDQKHQKHSQVQLVNMFEEMNSIVRAMNNVTKQIVYQDILSEHLLEAKRNILQLIRGKYVIDQKSQQMSTRQQLNYYQIRCRYFLRFKQWVQLLEKMQQMDMQQWGEYAKSTQFPQIIHFILNVIGAEVYLNAKLTIIESIDSYIKYVYTIQDQEKVFIQFHLTKIKVFLLKLKNISIVHLPSQDPIALFLKVNYNGKSINELLAQPRVYQMCEQYSKWRMYLASR